MLKDRLRGVRDHIQQRVKDKLRDFSEYSENARQQSEADGTQILSRDSTRQELETTGDEPPVVAQLVVEIRSDGSRTVARGALKDELSGEQVALEAKGSTPMQLAAQLAKSLLTTPFAARKLAREMLRARQLQAQDAPDKNKPDQ